MKKIISLILSVVMIVSFATVSYADANFTLTVDKNSVNIGDTITISVKTKDITVSAFNAKFGWNKDVFTCTSITWIKDSDIGTDAYKNKLTAVSTLENANNTGYVGWTDVGTSDTLWEKGDDGDVCTVVLTAIAAGTSNITYTEDTTGADAYKCADVVIDTVTVKGNEPTPPAAPVVKAPETAGNAKTWTVDIDGGYVAAGETLTATLYDTTNEADTQPVVLSLGNGVIGDAGWSFSLKATFTNLTKMADIGLKVSK